MIFHKNMLVSSMLFEKKTSDQPYDYWRSSSVLWSVVGVAYHFDTQQSCWILLQFENQNNFFKSISDFHTCCTRWYTT